MYVQSQEKRDRLNGRLRRIEGQVRGIQRMLDDERDCREIIQQLAAIRSAVQQVNLEVLRVYANQCLNESNSTTNNEEMLRYLISTLGKMP